MYGWVLNKVHAIIMFEEKLTIGMSYGVLIFLIKFCAKNIKTQFKHNSKNNTQNFVNLVLRFLKFASVT